MRGERGSAAAGEDGNKTHPPSPPPRYSTLAGYKFNIAALRRVFSPTFILRGVRQTGPRELTTRWTMRMRVAALPASIAPALAFTGTSVMRVDAEGKFCYHADTWDAVTNQAYFSAEAAAHVARQVATLARPPAAVAVAAGDLLRKAAKFEVRRFETPLRVASCAAGGGAGFAAFKPLVDYITDRGVAMTTPVLSGGGRCGLSPRPTGRPPPPPPPPRLWHHASRPARRRLRVRRVHRVCRRRGGVPGRKPVEGGSCGRRVVCRPGRHPFPRRLQWPRHLAAARAAQRGVAAAAGL